MANEFLITDVVDKQALQQLDSLKAKLGEAKSSYVDFATSIAKAISAPVGSLEELRAKAEDYEKTVRKLGGVESEMTKLQREQVSVLKDVSKQMQALSSLGNLGESFEKIAKSVSALNGVLDKYKSAAGSASTTTQQAGNAIRQAVGGLDEVSVDIAKVEKQVAAFDGKLKSDVRYLSMFRVLLDDNVKSMKELKKSYSDGSIELSDYLNESVKLERENAVLSAKIQRITAVLRNHSAAAIASTGSYNQMNAAMLELQKRWKALSEAEREGDLGKDTLQQIATLNAKLKELDASFGNYQRNVGNYSSGFNGLNMQVQQFMRELPSLSAGLNTFVLAISNNLPTLADEIRKARDEYKDLVAQGEKGVPVWEQLLESIFSWQSLLVVGITVLSMYGKEIMDWAGRMLKGKKSIDALAEAEKSLQEARKKGMSDSVKERTELALLYRATQDVGRSARERNAAADELQRMYPKYFGNMSNEVILSGKASEAYDKLTGSILANAQARAVEDKITEIAAKRLEAEIKMSNAEVAMEKNKAGKGQQVESIMPSTIGAVSVTTNEVAAAYRNASYEFNRYKTEVENFTTEIEELYKMVDFNALINGGEDGGKGSLDLQKELLDSRIALIEDERERELAENRASFEERMKQIKGNSAEESELRANLTELMRRKEDEINENYDQQLVAREKEVADLRLKYIREAAEAEREAAEAERDAIEGRYAGASLVNTQQLNDELDKLAGMYTKGLLSKEEYEEKKNELTEKYGIEQAKLTVAMLQELLGVEELGDDAILQLKTKLAEAEISLAEMVRDAEVEAANKSEEERKKSVEKMVAIFDELESVANEVVPGLGDVFDGLNDIFEKIAGKQKVTVGDILSSVATIAQGVNEVMGSFYDARIEELEKEEEENEEAGEKEIERIERLAETGAISEEEAEARKRAAEDKTAQKNDEIAKKKAALQTRQAKLEKATNIITTVMNTAVAVMKAWSQAGIFGAPMAAMIAALGAVQLATVIAQPIPKYAKGTRGHAGGLAVVGDGGRQEAVITDAGVWATPSVPTLVDLPKGAIVLPDLRDVLSLKGMHSDLLPLMERSRRGDGDGVNVTVNNDYARLERRMDAAADELRGIRKMMRGQLRSGDVARMRGLVH